MKLGIFIVAALCAAQPAYADHLTLIAQYQRAYGDQGDPHLLVLIANEYRDAGKQHEALSYYCSYIFTAPAGDDADYASQQAHVLKPGAETDHDACTTAKPTVVVRHEIDPMQYAIPEPPPRISKREILGLGTIGLALASFGVGLYEASQASHYQRELATLDPMLPRPAGAASWQSQMDTSETAEKWFLAAGGTALIGGAILYLTGRHDRIEAAGVTVAPTTSRRGAGLTLSGAF